MPRVGYKITYIFLAIVICLSILSSCKSSPKITKGTSIPLNSTTLKNSEQTKVHTNINNNTTKKRRINLSEIGNETNSKILSSNNNTITKNSTISTEKKINIEKNNKAKLNNNINQKSANTTTLLQANSLKTKNKSNIAILKSKKLPPLKLTSKPTLGIRTTKKVNKPTIVGKEKKIHITDKTKTKLIQKISKLHKKKGITISLIKNTKTINTKTKILNKQTKKIIKQTNLNNKNKKYIEHKHIKRNLEKKATKSHKERKILVSKNNKKQKTSHKIVKKIITQLNIKTNRRLETKKAEGKLYKSNITKTNRHYINHKVSSSTKKKAKKESIHKKLKLITREKSKENKKYIQNHLSKKISKNKKKLSSNPKQKRKVLKTKENSITKANNQNKSKKETSKTIAKGDVKSTHISKEKQIYSKNNNLHKLTNNKKQNNVVGSNNNHEYVIGPGDVLEIEVWKEPQLSAKVPVRPDGKITLPLINDIQAAGRTPLELRAAIQKALSKYLENPVVSVSVLGVNKKFFILGKVNAPGEYPLNSPITVLQAIALAKGFSDWADTKHIIILRQLHGKQIRLKFNYDDVAQGKHLDENVYLKPGDTIIVP